MASDSELALWVVTRFDLEEFRQISQHEATDLIG